MDARPFQSPNQLRKSRPSVGWSPSPTSPSDPHESRLDRTRAQIQYDELERKHQQLKACTRSLRAARVPGSDAGSVDAAFARVRDAAAEAIRALVAPRRRGVRRRNGSVQETVERLEMLSLASGNRPNDNDGVDGLMAAFGNMGFADATGAGRLRGKVEGGGQINPVWLATIRDWKFAVQKLLDSHRTSLARMLRACERHTTPETVEKMFDHPGFRTEIFQKLGTSKAPLITNEFTVAAEYWPTLERRFRHYDTLRETVMEVDRLLQVGEFGMEDGDRLVKNYVIVARGDAILEFANVDSYDSPVLRFQVSSHMLAATSPVFKAIFQGQASHPRALGRNLEELDGQEVPGEPPRFVTFTDGTEVKLYSMPQLESNKEESLTILLYAAHMQNGKVPRKVSFAQFTAIAEVCLRYQCTSPLEVVVEHRWLPAWVHMASTGDQADELLLISYTFGLRRIFTRMSKTAVLNLVDEEELRSKNWPERIKEKVWAMRTAKMAQVYAACLGAVQEYFQLPTSKRSDGNEQGTNHQSGGTMFRSALQLDKSPLPSYASLFSLTSAPRCPKGSHWCDATNLGWLLLVLNELQLLWTVITPAALPREEGMTPHPPAPRSLDQLLGALRSIPSPPQPVHPGGSGVCDPAPAFRAAVNDVYNSISGLTLFDVDGKRHGWALSKHHAKGPQSVLNIPLGTLGKVGLEGAVTAPVHMVGCAGLTEDEEGSDGNDSGDGESSQVDHSRVAFAPGDATCLRIMGSVENLEDLHALAVTNRTFYTAFKQNELALMRCLVRANRRLTLNVLVSNNDRSLPSGTREGRDNDKVLLQVTEDAAMSENGSDTAGGGWVGEQQSYCMVDGAVERQRHPAQQVGSGLVDPDGWGSGDPVGEDDDSMTEEEAQRILWPDPPFDPRHEGAAGDAGADGENVPPIPREDSGEKFLADEICIVQAAEEKALVVVGDKNLRQELDWRRGITNE